MFCSKCGTKQPDGSKFCAKCGTGITGVAAPGSAPSSRSNRTTVTIVGWFLVAVGVVLPFVVHAATYLSMPLLWVGFSLVLSGRSAIVRVGKGLVAMFVVMVAIFLIQDNLPSGSGVSAKGAAAREVSLSTLLGDYAVGNNEIAADQKYKGQVIRTTGILKSAKKDLADRPYFIVGLDMGLHIPDLQCTLASSEVGRAGSVTAGQRIVVQGEIQGLMLNVQAGDCVFEQPKNVNSRAEVSEVPVAQDPESRTAQGTLRPDDATSQLAEPTASQPASVPPGQVTAEAPTNEASNISRSTVSEVNPSFDCAKASTRVEKMICSDPSLAVDDADMAKYYKANLHASGANAPEVVTSQRAFLAARNACNSPECVSQAYERRRAELAQLGYVH